MKVILISNLINLPLTILLSMANQPRKKNLGTNIVPFFKEIIYYFTFFISLYTTFMKHDKYIAY